MILQLYTPIATGKLRTRIWAGKIDKNSGLKLRIKTNHANCLWQIAYMVCGLENCATKIMHGVSPRGPTRLKSRGPYLFKMKFIIF